MSDEFFLYLMTRTENVRFIAGLALAVSGVLAGFFTILTMIVAADTPRHLQEEEVGPYFKRLKQIICVAVVAAAVLVVTPSRNDMVLIFGGGALMDVARSGEAREIGGKTLAVIEQWLNEQSKSEANK